ncbi:MAG: transglycosylase domain-containing protein [Microcoleaceae cyanobacterium]
MGKLRILRRRSVQICLGLMLAGIGIRLLPLFFPIRAQDITQDQLAIEFSDRHGAPLGTLLSQDQNHTATVPLDQVSLHFIQAIIAAEDKRYYQHGALDLQAIGRAVLEAAQAGEIVSGASTITMQLARMLDRSPRTLSAKLLEIWTSWRLVAGMTPDEILQAYNNRKPKAANLNGVEPPSRTNKTKPPTD